MRIDQKNKETQSFTVFRGRGLSTTKFVVGQPKNDISDLHLEKIPHAFNLLMLEDEFRNRSVFWF